MSDLRQSLLDALEDGPQTTDALTETVGFERTVVIQELTRMRAAKLITHAPRNGWKVSVEGPAERKPASAARVVTAKRDDAAEKSTKAKKPAKREPPPKRISTPPQPTTKGSYIYGITEDGELTITDRKDFAKTLRISAGDTARLAALLDKWHYMLPKEAA